MSNLVVLTFDDIEQAGQAFAALKKTQKGGHLSIDDAAVVVKQESGKVEIKNQLDSGVKIGAFGGSIIALMLTGGLFPLAGLAIGVTAGGLVGKTLNMGIEPDFIQHVAEALKPNSSALFIIGSTEDPAVVLSALRPFQGTVFQTTLPKEGVDALLDALKYKE